jgi:hypothetical protein
MYVHMKQKKNIFPELILTKFSETLTLSDWMFEHFVMYSELNICLTRLKSKVQF